MPDQSGGRPRPGEARNRLGAELRRIRKAAGKTQRDIHGQTGSGHVSNVENGHTQPSWDFVEKYIAYGGEPEYLRSLYELARVESDEQRAGQRRGSQPGSFSAPPPPQEVGGFGLSDIRRHYVVERREERYSFDADGVASSLTCVSALRATSPGTVLICSQHSYEADQRPDLLDVRAGDGCVVEYVDRNPAGSIRVYFRLSRRLDPGDPEPYTCSYSVDINSAVRARPILLGYPGPGAKQYALQARFAPPSTPGRIWWFATKNELSATMPSDGHEIELDTSGSYRRTFDALVPGWCYGFAWQW